MDETQMYMAHGNTGRNKETFYNPLLADGSNN
jgi:hypothetical protein